MPVVGVVIYPTSRKEVMKKLVVLIRQTILDAIKQQITKLKYFCVSADYTPDITYIDQLIIIIMWIWQIMNFCNIF